MTEICLNGKLKQTSAVVLTLTGQAPLSFLFIFLMLLGPSFDNYILRHSSKADLNASFFLKCFRLDREPWKTPGLLPELCSNLQVLRRSLCETLPAACVSTS